MRANDRPASSERRRRRRTPKTQVSAKPVATSATLTAARAGDLNAWHRIVRAEQEPVFRSAYLVTHDRALAEESTRVVFVRAYRSLASLDDDTELRPWLMRLTDVAARAQLREQSHQRDGRPVEIDASPRLPATPYRTAGWTPALTPEDAAALADAFGGLTDNERAIIAARFAFGLGRDAAAVRLDVEPDAVEELLTAAIARLRVRVSREAGQLGTLSDDGLGSLVMAVVMSELPWTPDVASGVCDRLAREIVAYGVTPVVRERASGHDRRSPGRETTNATRPTRAPRFPAARSLGLVTGTSLLVVTLVFAAGGVGPRGAELLADLRSSVEGLLGETSAPSVTAADDAAVLTADPVPATDSAPTTEPVPSAAAVPTIDATTTAGNVLIGEVSPSQSKMLPAEPPVASMVGVRRVSDGSLRGIVRLEWLPDAGSEALTRARIERVGRDGTWSPLTWTAGPAPLLLEMEAGKTYGVRVRAVDASAVESVSPVAHLKLNVRKSASDRVVKSKGDWEKRRGPAGQPRLVALQPGARVSTRFSGTDVAVLGRLTPSLDAFGIRVNEGPWDSDPEPVARSGRMVLLRKDLDAGKHSLDLRAPTDGLAVDAFLILRSVNA